MTKKDIEIRDLFVEIRKKLNYTQHEFADVLNISRSTIAKIESKEIFVSEKLMLNFFTKYRTMLEPYNIYVQNSNSKEFKKQSTKSKFLEQIVKFFEEVDTPGEYPNSSNQNTVYNPNEEFVKNMKRLVFLEQENKELKAKIESQNEFIRQFLNDNNQTTDI